MATTIPKKALDIIKAKNFAHVATLFDDGSPQVTPVWVDTEDSKLLINSAEGRKKVDNLRRDARVAVEVNNSENPYQYVEIRGHVTALRHEGADAHIDKLAKKYLDADSYPYRKPGEQRVIIEIEPDSVTVNS